MHPSHLLFVLFLTISSFFTSNYGLNDDVLALIVIKSDITSDPFGHLALWSEDADDPCNWPGLTCSSTHRVTSLTIPSFSLSGRLSRGILRLDSLQSLFLQTNNLSGYIFPDLITSLPYLRTLDISSNRLSGNIPDDFFSQCNSIRTVSFANNALSGQIPDNVAACSSLLSLNLSSNELTGPIPSGVWSLTGLRALDLSGNMLSGTIPVGLSGKSSLRTISLRGNKIVGEIPQDIGAARLLKSIDFGYNGLTGGLPDSMRWLFGLKVLCLGSNDLTGEIPEWIGEMAALQSLDLSWNRFTGSIPDEIGGCKGLVEVDLSRNDLSGELPWWVFGLGLQRFLVAGNGLSGWVKIQGNAGRLLAMRVLDLSQNVFSGEVSPTIGSLSSLEVFNLSENEMSGSVPVSVGELKLMQVMDLSANRINASIPVEIGKCTSLVTLNLSKNNISGSIPTTIANLTNLQNVDLSQNKLTGTLPTELSNLPHLHNFNISHNLLSGDLPSSPFFNTIPSSSLSDNPGLCGSALNNSCNAVLPKPIVLNPNSSSSNPNAQPMLSPDNSLHHKIILSISTLIAIAGAAAIVVGVVTITVLNLRVRASASHSAAVVTLSDDYLSQSPENDANSGKLVMFGGGELGFSAGGHALLNKDCELGRGGFGAVYKTVLKNGQQVAIKKLTVSSLVKSRDDFEREVKLLGKVRHLNLVALRGFYWTSSLQLLIYDFIPGGNLHKQLHECPAENVLSWKDRFDIILGIARGIAHLHLRGIVHYNLKSSNILFDGSGEPKVGDYGLAKLLPMLDRYVLSSKIQSALGYMAPEFACRTVKITEKCDVYGFGVLVLEILTGRRPVEYLEDDVVVLCDLVRGALEEGRLEECMDGKLSGVFPMEEAVPVIKLGLVCTSQVPSNRPRMDEVVNILELVNSPQDSPEDELV